MGEFAWKVSVNSNQKFKGSFEILCALIHILVELDERLLTFGFCKSLCRFPFYIC